jgi:sulfite reductase (NADPH) hemoprotein beta-component
MAEAERFLPSFIDKVEEVMAKHGLSDEHIDARDGLPERLWPRDAGGSMVGKAPGRYNLHLGGNRIGTRIPRMFKERTLPSRKHCLAR